MQVPTFDLCLHYFIDAIQMCHPLTGVGVRHLQKKPILMDVGGLMVLH